MGWESIAFIGKFDLTLEIKDGLTWYFVPLPLPLEDMRFSSVSFPIYERSLLCASPEYENGKADVTHLLPKNWKAISKDFNQR